MNHDAYDGPTREAPFASSERHSRATARMLALFGGHEWFGPRPGLFEDVRRPRRLAKAKATIRESDADYFQRRSREERRAAATAAGPEARKVHAKLADLHARRSAAIAAFRVRPGDETFPVPARRLPAERPDGQ